MALAGDAEDRIAAGQTRQRRNLPDSRRPDLRAVEPLPVQAPQRLVSLDALRGFTIFWILGGDALAWALKDVAGDKPGIWPTFGRFMGAQLGHVDWEGLSFYDLIFPMLLFVTGVSIVYSLPGLVEREGLAAAHWRVLRRAALLYVLGVLFYGGVSQFWPDIRLLGVLQRIAICYLFASILFLNLRPRGLIAAFVVLLVGYWAVMTFVPVPGVGPGIFEMGANLAHWIDSLYLPGMKWQGTWDPEGLLSTIPAIGTCVLGVLAGLLLKNERFTPQEKALWLMGAGVLAVPAGYLWGLQFPVIKNLWTSSYVLVAGGYSLFFLGAFYQILDIWKRTAWSAIFVWIGANAITLYLLYNFVDFGKVAARLVGGDVGAFLDVYVGNGIGKLATAVVSLVLAVLVARFLYRRKIFLRV